MDKIIKGRIKTIEMSGIKEFYHTYRFLIWFFIGIVSGTLCMNFFCGYFYDKLGIYNSFLADSYRNIEVSSVKLFWYGVKALGMEVIILLAVSVTAFGKAGLNIFCGYKGFSISMLICAYVLKYGAGGALIYIISIFPHYLPYGLLVCIVLSMCRSINEIMGTIRKNRYMGGGIADSIKLFFSELSDRRKTVLAFIWIISLIIIISFLEVYVNMGIMKKII